MGNIPMVICGKIVKNDCEACGYVTILAQRGQRVALGKHICPNCGHVFEVFIAPDGGIGILDNAANGKPPLPN